MNENSKIKRNAMTTEAESKTTQKHSRIDEWIHSVRFIRIANALADLFLFAVRRTSDELFTVRLVRSCFAQACFMFAPPPALSISTSSWPLTQSALISAPAVGCRRINVMISSNMHIAIRKATTTTNPMTQNVAALSTKCMKLLFSILWFRFVNARRSTELTECVSSSSPPLLSRRAYSSLAPRKPKNIHKPLANKNEMSETN